MQLIQTLVRSISIAHMLIILILYKLYGKKIVKDLINYKSRKSCQCIMSIKCDLKYQICTINVL